MDWPGYDPRLAGPPMMMAPAPPMRSRSRGRYQHEVEQQAVYTGYDPNPRMSYRPLQTIQPDPMPPIPVFVGPPTGVPGGYRHPPGHDHAVQRASSRRNHDKERRPRSKSARRHREAAEHRANNDNNNDPLTEWSAWRTVINDGLTRDLVKKQYREIPVGEEFDRLMKPPRKTKHGVYHYSTAIDQGTQLQREDFVNFGIPRANPSTLNRPRSRSNTSDSSSESEDEDQRPFYTINKIKVETNHAQDGLREDVTRQARNGRSRDRGHRDADYGARQDHRRVYR